ncbi:MAG: hypothetical protein AAF702_44440 [Chloroflexota bacterium]
MSHRYFITSVGPSGTVSIELSSGDYLVRNWVPNSAQLSPSALSASTVDAYENVIESIDVRVHDAADKATVQNDIRAIEQMITLGQNRNSLGFGPKAYFQVIIDGTPGETWQSEIVGGYVSIGATALREWSTLGADFNIQLERKYYWELSVEQPITLTNYLSASGTAVSIFNASGQNWVSFDSVPGSLPTPIKIRALNSGATLTGSQQIFLSNNVFNDPDSVDPYLIAAQLDVGAANETWGTAVDHSSPNPRWAWELPAALLADAAGDYFRVLASFTSLSTGFYLKAYVYVVSGGLYSRIHEGEEIFTGGPLGSFELLDLGSFPIPPGDLSFASNVGVGITVRALSSGGATINFVQLMPVTSFRHLNKIGYGVPNGDAIFIDNGIEENVYGGTDTAQVPIFISQQSHLHAWPGRFNKVSILFDEVYQFPGGHESTVEMWVRPRRLTL